MGLINTDTGLQFGTGLVWLAGGIGQDGLMITSSTSGAALFLAEWGPYGMAMDFTDASIAIDDSTDVLDYSSQGTVSSTTGALLGPGSKLTNTAPSLKNTEQADGYTYFQAHNLYANSAAPANQSVTTGMVTGGTYAITLTGSVSITLSGAATGTVTAGTTTFTAASGTLTCGSTSGSGTVHLRRTPSVSTYVATPTVLGATTGFDLPYVYSAGVKTGIMVEPAATNLRIYSTNSNSSWTGSGATVTAAAATSFMGVANGSTRVTFSSAPPSFVITGSDSSVTSGTTYTLSTIVQYENTRYIQFTGGSAGFGTGVWENFDLVAGVAGSAGSGATPANVSITAMPNNRFRIRVTGAATATSSAVPLAIAAVDSLSAARLPAYTGGATTLVVDHFQLETGTVATSPIITYGSTVLRAVDQLTLAGSEFPLSSSEGTLYYEGRFASVDVNANCGITVWDGSTANRVDLRRNTFLVSSGGATQANILSAVATTTNTRRAGRYIVNSFSQAQDGAIVGTPDVSGLAPVGLTALRLTIDGATLTYNGVIARVAWFTTAFSDANLQGVTAP